jgi:hypothetical protein
MGTKIVKYAEYIKEDTYKVGDDGTMEKQDWELHADHNMNMYKRYTDSVNTEDLFDCEKGYRIKYKGKIVGVLSDEISEEKSKKILDILKSN